ncbi:MAG: hypothetical protein HQ582_08520, partial [Planctomycetes bacterium]|nr:hypothetical protein [Planctomycetota bacterium]
MSLDAAQPSPCLASDTTGAPSADVECASDSTFANLPRLATMTPRWGFAEWFVIAQTALPALMFLPGTQPFRVVLRILPFGASLAALCLFRVSWSHPATRWIAAALAYLAVMIFHPTTNTVLAGFAQVMLCLAVVAPLFWAPAMVRSVGQLKRLLLILLVCNGVNSAVGVLQVYDPDRWLPSEFSSVITNSRYGLNPLTYVGADGRRIVRPPGLFDAPGAVCGPAMVAALLGIVVFFQPANAFWKAAGPALAALGAAAILFSQVRTALLIMVGTCAVFVAVLFVQKRMAKVGGIVALGLLLFLASWTYAVNVGGKSVEERFAVLVDDGIVATYDNTNRGTMLTHAFTQLLPQYPLGAGLGRWGMMRAYFGDESNLASPMIWSELQINSWILDGGIVLLVLYSVAILVTTRNQLHIAFRSRDPGLQAWAPPVVALCAGTIALIFGFTPFTTQ